jgi:hypothetical protein
LIILRHANDGNSTAASFLPYAAESTGAGDLGVSPDEIALIDRAFPLGHKPASLSTI